MRIHAPGEYFHVFSRGVRKHSIFENVSDYLRFLFVILAYQGEDRITNTSREVKRSIHNKFIKIDSDLENKVLEERSVELVAFCLMPNHFHLIVKELSEDGLSKYMQRVLTAYSKYFNIKHEKSGYVFQGKYKSVLVSSDKQLLHLSAYIHKNPIELGWKNNEEKYLWSSYQDFLGKNRFNNLLSPGVIMDRYEGKFAGYKRFVGTSLAKEGSLDG